MRSLQSIRDGGLTKMYRRLMNRVYEDFFYTMCVCCKTEQRSTKILQHMQTCPKRPVRCDEGGCNEMYLLEDMDSHKIANCVMRECPLGCDPGVMLMAGEVHKTVEECLKYHQNLSTDLKKRLVECEGQGGGSRSSGRVNKRRK
jgi:hypothetical protein